MTRKININPEMGDEYGRWRLGPDEELIEIVGLTPALAEFVPVGAA